MRHNVQKHARTPSALLCLVACFAASCSPGAGSSTAASLRPLVTLNSSAVLEAVRSTNLSAHVRETASATFGSLADDLNSIDDVEVEIDGVQLASLHEYATDLAAAFTRLDGDYASIGDFVGAEIDVGESDIVQLVEKTKRAQGAAGLQLLNPCDVGTGMATGGATGTIVGGLEMIGGGAVMFIPIPGMRPLGAGLIYTGAATAGISGTSAAIGTGIANGACDPKDPHLDRVDTVNSTLETSTQTIRTVGSSHVPQPSQAPMVTH